MYPQYERQQTGGDMAIWLLLTVGALLVPTVVIAICCIRRHCWQTIPARRPRSSSFDPFANRHQLLTNASTSWTHRVRDFLTRSPIIKPMEKRALPNTIMDVKPTMSLRSYNGPYVEPSQDNRKLSSTNTTPQSVSRSNSLKTSHVHWPDGTTTSRGEDLRSIKDRQFTPRKQPLPGGDLLHTNTLTESPSSHRRIALIPPPSSALSHLIQTAIIPAGSTVTNTGASQLLVSNKQSSNQSNGSSIIV